MKKSSVIVTVLAVLSVLCSGGCVWLAVGAAGAGVGYGTYAFIRGELEVAYPNEFQQTWSAVLDALESLEIRKKSAVKDAFGGKIEAARADGTSIKIAIKPITSASTSVKIRVGVFGNQTISEMIADEIDRNL
jgi:hypothetical protein